MFTHFPEPTCVSLNFDDWISYVISISIGSKPVIGLGRWIGIPIGYSGNKLFITVIAVLEMWDGWFLWGGKTSIRQLLSIDTRHCVKFGDDLFARDYFMNDSRIRLGAHVV